MWHAASRPCSMDVDASAGNPISVCAPLRSSISSGKGPNDRGSSRYHLTRTVEASLRRLGTDRLDILYLHYFDARTDLEETLRGVELLPALSLAFQASGSPEKNRRVSASAAGSAQAHGW